jgi:hypothetical protein
MQHQQRDAHAVDVVYASHPDPKLNPKPGALNLS